MCSGLKVAGVAHRVDGVVAAHARHPGEKPAVPGIVAGHALPHFEQAFLQQVLGHCFVAHHPPSHGQQAGGVALVQKLEGALVARQQTPHQRGFVRGWG